MKDLQEPAPLLGETKVPKGTMRREFRTDQQEKASCSSLSFKSLPPHSPQLSSLSRDASRLAREATTEDDKNVKQQEATSGKAGTDLSAQGSGTRTPSGSSSYEKPEAKKRPRPNSTDTKDEEGGASSSNSEKTLMPAPLCASKQEDQKENEQKYEKAVVQKGFADSREPIRLHPSMRSGFTPSPQRNPAIAAASPGHIHALALSTIHHRMQVAAPTMRPPPDPPPASAGQSKEIQKKDATEKEDENAVVQKGSQDAAPESEDSKEVQKKDAPDQKDENAVVQKGSQDAAPKPEDSQADDSKEDDSKENEQKAATEKNDTKDSKAGASSSNSDKDGKKDDKQGNDKGDEKEAEPHAEKRTAPQDQEHAAKRTATCSKDADAKTTTHLLEQATAVDKESCILKIFHMSLRSYNCLKQFLGFPKHYLILEIFICVNEESQRARA